MSTFEQRQAMSDQVDNHLREALGDLFDEVEIKAIHDDPATFSSTDTPMWHLLQEMMQKAHPGAPSNTFAHRWSNRRSFLSG